MKHILAIYTVRDRKTKKLRQMRFIVKARSHGEIALAVRANYDLSGVTVEKLESHDVPSAVCVYDGPGEET